MPVFPTLGTMRSTVSSLLQQRVHINRLATLPFVLVLAACYGNNNSSQTQNRKDQSQGEPNRAGCSQPKSLDSLHQSQAELELAIDRAASKYSVATDLETAVDVLHNSLGESSGWDELVKAQSGLAESIEIHDSLSSLLYGAWAEEASIEDEARVQLEEGLGRSNQYAQFAASATRHSVFYPRKIGEAATAEISELYRFFLLLQRRVVALHALGQSESAVEEAKVVFRLASKTIFGATLEGMLFTSLVRDLATESIMLVTRDRGSGAAATIKDMIAVLGVPLPPPDVWLGELALEVHRARLLLTMKFTDLQEHIGKTRVPVDPARYLSGIAKDIDRTVAIADILEDARQGFFDSSVGQNSLVRLRSLYEEGQSSEVQLWLGLVENILHLDVRRELRKVALSVRLADTMAEDDAQYETIIEDLQKSNNLVTFTSSESATTITIEATVLLGEAYYSEVARQVPAISIGRIRR